MKSLMIFSMQLLCIVSLAQVGINTDTPQQALDVNGKIKIADDTTTPLEGTIRYNQNSKDFEGFDGQYWYSLTGRNSYATVLSPSAGEDPYANWTLESDFTITFTVTFSAPVDPFSFIVGDSFIVQGDGMAAGTLTWNMDNTQVTFHSSNSFFDFSDAGCGFQLILKGTGSAVVKDQRGFVIDGDGNGQPGGDFSFWYAYLC